MSTAESELVEAVEGMALGDAVDTLLLEHEPEHVKRMWVDNSAAVSVLSLGPCAWRTRHLRLRAHHLRRRLANTDWLVGYLPGRFQVADLGTKALPDQRVQELKGLLGMGHARCSWRASSDWRGASVCTGSGELRQAAFTETS